MNIITIISTYNAAVSNAASKIPGKERRNFIAGRPKAALLFWFFGDFRCGALLFMVFLIIYKYKRR